MNRKKFIAETCPIDRFIHWIRERELVRQRKALGKSKPWTNDKIIQQYRFCNVVRMEDKVSQWLLRNWYEPNFNHDNMLLAVTLARFFNKPETLETIGFPKTWRPKRIVKVIRDIIKRGDTAFNAAYIVRGGDGEDKVDGVVNYFCESVKDRADFILAQETAEGTHTELMRCYGMGSFSAGQVVADLVVAIDHNWPDLQTWAPKGPGSARGINRIHGREIDTPMSQMLFCQELQELISLCSNSYQLPKDLLNRMTAHDWQNCLCEFDKYERVLHGEGEPKQKYPGKE